MRWSDSELAQAGKLIARIQSYAGPRRITNQYRRIHLAVSEAADLRNGIWGGLGVIFIRHLYRALGFDEHRMFEWRLEHKLVQALVLDAFAPGSVPVTRGLAALQQAAASPDLRAAIAAEFASGYYLKPALGDSSGDCDTPDQTARILAAQENAVLQHASDLTAEAFLVQQRIPIQTEFRVHTLEDRVIEDLTFHRYGKGDIPGERDAPNAFVQSVLDRLPDGIVAGAICGWDIARTPESKLLVIEVNFSGFHPVHNRGFQCSGWFHDEQWGALSSARLVRFLEERCGVAVIIEPDDPDLPEENRYYDEVNRCRELLRRGKFT